MLSLRTHQGQSILPQNDTTCSLVSYKNNFWIVYTSKHLQISSNMPMYLLFLILIRTTTLAEIQLEVETTYGPIKGEVTPLVRQFLSIPYAAPSDTTRWKPPQPHQGWKSVLVTTSIPPGCPQQCTSNIPNMFVHFRCYFNFLHFLYLNTILILFYLQLSR